jgi:thiamine-phosphate pyrophosphorylase
VTDRRSLAGASGESAELFSRLVDMVSRAAAAGVDWVQIREKDLAGAAMFELTRDAVKRAVGRTRILVNDRLDVALAAGAGGVHLGERSLPVETVVRWLRAPMPRPDGVSGESGQAPENAARVPPSFLTGVSCHSLEAALAAERAGAGYVFFGPVFETPSKEAFGPPQGLERLAEVCRRVRIPVLAIGGVTLDNAASCLSSGAGGIAAIRLFQESRDLAACVATLRRLG